MHKGLDYYKAEYYRKRELGYQNHMFIVMKRDGTSQALSLLLPSVEEAWIKIASDYGNVAHTIKYTGSV